MGSASLVGFVGIGNMGWPMASNLIRAGWQVVAYDRDKERQDSFVAEHRCRSAAAPEDFRDADYVITMLPTGQIVREVLLAWSGGIASGLSPSCLVIDMSSSDPSGTRELGHELAKRRLTLVDAPVSGGVTKATDGTLAIMLGGDDNEAVERAVPVIDAMSARIFRTGPLGSGHAMKALNNFVAGAGFVAAAEALVVGRRFGLDPSVVVDVLNASTGRNFSTESVFVEHVLTRTFATGFSLGLLTKDVGLASDLADAVDVPAPLCHLVRDRLAEALAELGGNPDHSMAMTYWDGIEGPPKAR